MSKSKPKRKPKEKLPDIWEHLEKKGVKIERRKTVKHRLSLKGKHHFEVEDNQERSIVCTTCPVRHGYKIGAYELSDYRIKSGVLYYRGKPLNRTR